MRASPWYPCTRALGEEMSEIPIFPPLQPQLRLTPVVQEATSFCLPPTSRILDRGLFPIRTQAAEICQLWPVGRQRYPRSTRCCLRGCSAPEKHRPARSGLHQQCPSGKQPTSGGMEPDFQLTLKLFDPGEFCKTKPRGTGAQLLSESNPH